MEERRKKNGIVENEGEPECKGHINNAETDFKCKLLQMSKEDRKEMEERKLREAKAYMGSADGRRPHHGRMRVSKVPSACDNHQALPAKTFTSHCHFPAKTFTSHFHLPVKTKETAETGGMAKTEEDIFYSALELQDQEIARMSCEKEELRKELEDMDVQLQNLMKKEVPQQTTLDYPDDVVVHTINHGCQATAFYMSTLCNRSSNKSNKERCDDASEA
jgi:hypothetical protein